MTETAALWQRRVAGWAESGMSCKEYAEQLGVNPNTLAGWRHKLRRRGLVTRPSGPSAIAAADDEVAGELGFVDVTRELAAALALEPGVIELEVGGAVVRLRGQVDAEALGRVLDVLEGRRCCR
ncbi:MAG: helix-turn-helix domain-containing protein [Myxococcales bacterium]|nr:helix-turn-helix domain-containing protein [Myxococcales bacterium]